MPGIDLNSAIIGLWVLTAIILAWTFVPAFLSSLGGTRFLCGETPEAATAEARPSEPDCAYWVDQLLELGYEPLGSAWIRVDFAGAAWSHYSRVRVFRNESRQCYAFMQKAPAPYNFWPGAVFATCWSDGRLLTTDNNLAAEPDPDDEYIRQGAVSLKLDVVEVYHRATTEALCHAGAKIDPDPSLDALLQSLQRHLGPENRRQYGREGTQYLFAHGLIHVCVSTVPAYLLGITHWSVPLSNLVLGLMLWLGEIAQKRQEAHAAREGLRRLQMLPAPERGEMEI